MLFTDVRQSITTRYIVPFSTRIKLCAILRRAIWLILVPVVVIGLYRVLKENRVFEKCIISAKKSDSDKRKYLM